MMGEDMAGSSVERSESNNFFTPGQPGASIQNQQLSRGFGMLGSSDSSIPVDPAGSDGSRYYTIQRVNGNGGNGKGDGTAGPHKHTLQESDRVKKNSIARHFLKIEKVKKKTQVRESLPQSGFSFRNLRAGFSNSNTNHLCGSYPFAIVQISRYFSHVLTTTDDRSIKLAALE